MLAEHEIFYNNWADQQIYQIDKLLLDSMSKSSVVRPRAFRSVDIVEEQGGGFFEILLGTQDGQIFHAALDYS